MPQPRGRLIHSCSLPRKDPRVFRAIAVAWKNDQLPLLRAGRPRRSSRLPSRGRTLRIPSAPSRPYFISPRAGVRADGRAALSGGAARFSRSAVASRRRYSRAAGSAPGHPREDADDRPTQQVTTRGARRGQSGARQQLAARRGAVEARPRGRRARGASKASGADPFRALRWIREAIPSAAKSPHRGARSLRAPLRRPPARTAPGRAPPRYPPAAARARTPPAAKLVPAASSSSAREGQRVEELPRPSPSAPHRRIRWPPAVAEWPSPRESPGPGSGPQSPDSSRRRPWSEHLAAARRLGSLERRGRVRQARTTRPRSRPRPGVCARALDHVALEARFGYVDRHSLLRLDAARRRPASRRARGAAPDLVAQPAAYSKRSSSAAASISSSSSTISFSSSSGVRTSSSRAAAAPSARHLGLQREEVATCRRCPSAPSPP